MQSSAEYGTGGQNVPAERLSALPPLQCGGCRRIDPDRQERLARAMLANIANWEARLEEIAAASIPITGNKSRALSLLRDMHMCRLSLARLAGLEPNE